MARLDDAQLHDQVKRARKNFAAMAATYALGTFNDNFFKQAVMLTAVAAGMPAYQGYALLVFTLPFVLFAAPAGWAADRFSKRNVVIASKFMELAAMLFGAAGIITGDWLLIFVMLATMGIQATVFSPSLNGAIPELYPASYVTRANAVIKIMSTGAILAGVSLAGVALDRPGTWLHDIPMGPLTVAVVVVCVALLGAVSSFGVPKREAASPREPFPWSWPVKTLQTLNDTRADALLAITIGANAVFWFAASLQLLLINNLGLKQFHFSMTVTSYLIAAELIGMAIGGVIVGRTSHGRRWYGVLAPAALFLGALMVAVSVVPYVGESARTPVLFVLLTAMGIAGGFFLVPAESFIQVRPAADKKGAVLSAANFAAFTGIILSSFAANALNAPGANIQPTVSFAITGALTIALGLWLAFVWNSSRSRRSPAVVAVLKACGIPEARAKQ